MPILLGDDTIPTVQDPRQAISSLSRKFPKPSNALAIAVLAGVWEGTNATVGVQAGLPQDVANRFLHPLGIIPRLRLVACGWKNPGDKFKLATDTLYWKRPYDLPLSFWPSVQTWVDLLAKANVGGNFVFEQAVADADPAALSRAIVRAEEDLRELQTSKTDVCLPFIPSTKTGVLPSANNACLVRLGVGKAIEPVKPVLDEVISIFGVSLPWWVWVALGYVAIKQLDRR